MDRKGRKKRARRDLLAEIEPRGLGRKGRPSETFPTKKCENVDGGTVVRIVRERKKYPFDKYALKVRVGGTRCTRRAVSVKPGGKGAYCEIHGG